MRFITICPFYFLAKKQKKGGRKKMQYLSVIGYIVLVILIATFGPKVLECLLNLWRKDGE